MPGWKVIKRKPHPFGLEFKSIACSVTGLMMGLEAQGRVSSSWLRVSSSSWLRLRLQQVVVVAASAVQAMVRYWPDCHR